jgi:hypothetical protein
MDASIVNDVDQAIADIFGMMFFIALSPLAEIPQKEEWDADKTFIVATININAKGNLQPMSLYFPKKLAREITINFLGIDGDEVDDEKMLDSMQEATNMTVGGLLGRIDPKASCSIGIPVAKVIIDFSPERLLDNPELRVYQTDSGLLWVSSTTFHTCDSR